MLGCNFLLKIIVILSLFISSVSFADIPRRAKQYKDDIEWAYKRCGVSPKYYSWLLGQIEQESSWVRDAESKYARGLAQNTPANEEDLLRRYPELRKYQDRLDPKFQFLGQCLMMKRLMNNLTGSSYKDNMRISLRSYNGGVGYILRERNVSRESGEDPNVYENLENHCSIFRANWACDENLSYSPHIEKRRVKYVGWLN